MTIKCGDAVANSNSQALRPSHAPVTLTFDPLDPKSIPDRDASKSSCVPNLVTLKIQSISVIARKDILVDTVAEGG